MEGLGITNDTQLREIAKKMGLPEIQYIGYVEDLRKLPNGFSIINLGDKKRGGTHWTMLYADPHEILYFDSYGVGPEDKIIKLAGNRIIRFSTRQIQGYDEEFCGIWVLLAIDAIYNSKKSKAYALNDFVNRYDRV